jgi:[ribosomal protein S5]-alanine N-acetyltransferase
MRGSAWSNAFQIRVVDMVKHPAPHPTLVTRRLRLRQFSNEDVDAMHECFADPEAMRFWNTPVHSKRIETERAVHRFIDCTPSYYRFWAVADAKTNLCLGMVNYHDGHIRSKRVAIGYIVNPSRRREGIGAEAVLAMLQFCFGYLGIHRVQAFIHPDNAASRELVEKLGFRCEGRLRDNLRVGDEWRDDMLYALLATERSGQT